MSKRKLRVFEAFAGIGAQASALSRMNIDYEIVGISDWFVDAIEFQAKILNRKKLCASIFSARGSDTERMCLLFLANPILCFQNIKRSFLLTDAFGTDTRDVNAMEFVSYLISKFK